MTKIIIKQMPAFRKAYKRIHSQKKIKVDEAILAIIKSPEIGQEKKGDLSGVFVHKFKLSRSEMLLAYEWNKKERLLLAMGTTEVSLITNEN